MANQKTLEELPRWLREKIERIRSRLEEGELALIDQITIDCSRGSCPYDVKEYWAFFTKKSADQFLKIHLEIRDVIEWDSYYDKLLDAYVVEIAYHIVKR